VGGEFKWRHFAGELILLCVRWYCRYGISYRDLEEMMGEWGGWERRHSLSRAFYLAQEWSTKYESARFCKSPSVSNAHGP
jgi:transposase-like protein